LLKIHVIPTTLTSDLTVASSKAEAFPKASPTALKVAVPTTSVVSTILGPGVGEESKKIGVEAMVVARILHQQAASARILLQVEAEAT
jgi:hypothetical protein